MAGCCACGGPSSSDAAKAGLPLICLVPRGKGPGTSAAAPSGQPTQPPPGAGSEGGEFQLLDDEYLRKHFTLPQRALYLDPFRRPLITFPMTQEGRSKNFNMAKKLKINQQILDGILDPCEAILAPSTFPYPNALLKDQKGQTTTTETDEEIIYILQLPDWEFTCPTHGQTIRTPRFIWHSCKKSDDKASNKMKSDDKSSNEMRKGPGPMHRPKPWLLSRHTDFDYFSQW